MISFKKTYSIDPTAPPPMTSDDYRIWLNDKWQTILDSDPTERTVQDFLECHPVLVPGAFGSKGLSSGHAPFPGALISQPRLYGYQGRIPDFMWISKNSTHLNPVFIEIESPRKKIFKANGDPTADFTQARHQLAQWRQWIRDPNNQASFINAYDLNDLCNLTFEPEFVLIYGRRSEFEDEPARKKMMGQLLSGADETLMSYDRLSFDPKADQLPCARHGRNGYTIKHLPPTYLLGPRIFYYNTRLRGLSSAVDHNHLVSDERKKFIKKRLPYWETWAKGAKGICNFSDCE